MIEFLTLPRYPFTRALLKGAPEERGIFGLFDGRVMIYVGCAEEDTIQTCLLRHRHGEHGACTMQATHYTWEITPSPGLRESEILTRFQHEHGTRPRCQQAA